MDPWGFGVASVDEGEVLRAAGITRPILVLTPLLPQWIDQYLHLDLRPSIGDVAALESWIARGDRPFHVEIDTGMSRAGVRWDDRRASTGSPLSCGTRAGGKASSPTFVAAESDATGTLRQWDRFQEVLQALPRRPALVHAANSAAALQGKLFAGDLVRPGIFLYGGAAGGHRTEAGRRTPGSSRGGPLDRRGRHGGIRRHLACRPARPPWPRSAGLRGRVPPGSSAPGPERLRREIELNGRLAPVVGRVTMDMCMVAAGEDVAPGDVATVFGGTDLARPAGRGRRDHLLRAADPARAASRPPLREES